ncbi:13588_t:CDS:2 [Ambispora leptoticha]|uniref:Late endosomal/lysosomal adaptor and MAPK and MTOR activator 5 n=1 Tax=Ambispora leptoticha TaxID=144679 RepID=A0A9N8YZT4_9GLOM|nr:13588_t:CDS:2 [Ambispora leptoticha]
MEDKIETVLDELNKAEGVKGVLVADKHGLCLGTRGIAKPSSAGFVAAVASNARELYQHDEQNRRQGNEGGGVGNDSSGITLIDDNLKEQLGQNNGIVSGGDVAGIGGESLLNSNNITKEQRISPNQQQLASWSSTVKIEAEENVTILIQSDGSYTLAIFK